MILKFESLRKTKCTFEFDFITQVVFGPFLVEIDPRDVCLYHLLSFLIMLLAPCPGLRSSFQTMAMFIMVVRELSGFYNAIKTKICNCTNKCPLKCSGGVICVY